jgi:hypothetical protein
LTREFAGVFEKSFFHGEADGVGASEDRPVVSAEAGDRRSESGGETGGAISMVGWSRAQGFGPGGETGGLASRSGQQRAFVDKGGYFSG